MRVYGWLGLGIIIVAEALLFIGQPIIGRWFTSLSWTGYVLLLDGIVARLTGRSYLTTARVECVLVVLVSIACWWLFEWYNAPRFWRGGPDAVGIWWQYHNLEPNLFLRRVSYDWAFATIFPALFLTAAAFRGKIFKDARVRPWRPPRGALNLSIAMGVFSVTLPLLVVSAWLVPLVWLGWMLLLEPLNYRRGRPSWLASLAEGDASLLLSLLASGALCGLLWEFWNYWATAKWTYTVPYLAHVKLFEMPILGYFGFPVFALECYAIYHSVRGWLLAHGDVNTPLI